MIDHTHNHESPTEGRSNKSISFSDAQTDKIVEEAGFERGAAVYREAGEASATQKTMKELLHERAKFERKHRCEIADAEERLRETSYQMQYELLLLLHASKCTTKNGKCQTIPYCDRVKILLRHSSSCNGMHCNVCDCKLSREALRHHRDCAGPCNVCNPVRDTIRKNGVKDRLGQLEKLLTPTQKNCTSDKNDRDAFYSKYKLFMEKNGQKPLSFSEYFELIGFKKKCSEENDTDHKQGGKQQQSKAIWRKRGPPDKSLVAAGAGLCRKPAKRCKNRLTRWKMEGEDDPAGIHKTRLDKSLPHDPVDVVRGKTDGIYCQLCFWATNGAKKANGARDGPRRYSSQLKLKQCGDCNVIICKWCWEHFHNIKDLKKEWLCEAIENYPAMRGGRTAGRYTTLAAAFVRAFDNLPEKQRKGAEDAFSPAITAQIVDELGKEDTALYGELLAREEGNLVALVAKLKIVRKGSETTGYYATLATAFVRVFNDLSEEQRKEADDAFSPAITARIVERLGKDEQVLYTKSLQKNRGNLDTLLGMLRRKRIASGFDHGEKIRQGRQKRSDEARKKHDENSRKGQAKKNGREDDVYFKWRCLRCQQITEAQYPGGKKKMIQCSTCTKRASEEAGETKQILPSLDADNGWIPLCRAAGCTTAVPDGETKQERRRRLNRERQARYRARHRASRSPQQNQVSEDARKAQSRVAGEDTGRNTGHFWGGLFVQLATPSLGGGPELLFLGSTTVLEAGKEAPKLIDARQKMES
jgi:hypothetical protein